MRDRQNTPAPSHNNDRVLFRERPQLARFNGMSTVGFLQEFHTCLTSHILATAAHCKRREFLPDAIPTWTNEVERSIDIEEAVEENVLRFRDCFRWLHIISYFTAHI